MVPLTPGRLTALWLVLRSLAKLGGRVDAEELVGFAAKSSLRSGGLPVRDGLRLAVRGRFVHEAPLGVSLTETGNESLRLCAEDEPNSAVRRLFLSVLVLMDPPAWVAYWQGDPTSLELLLSDTDRSLLGSAGLYPHKPDEQDLARGGWWDALSVVPLSESVLALRKAIGDAGEELSIAYERARLEAEGFPELAQRVWWAGRESPAYGFDVGSFVGRGGTQAPDAPLAIEVKSVAYPVMNIFPLHLTVHEWRTARRLGPRHRFHLWDSVKIPMVAERPPRKPTLAVLNEFTSHLASNPACGGACTWESMLVELPIN